MNIQKILELGAATEGGSGTGCSHYMSMAGCHLRHTLSQEARLRGEAQSSGYAADVGTFYHLLQEYYWTRQIESETAFEVSDLRSDPTFESMEEALRLFQYFRTHVCPPEIRNLVNVIGAELQLPQNEKEAQILKDFFGVDFTARIDLVIEVPDLEVGAAFSERMQLESPLEPGVYILDWKTKQRRITAPQSDFMYGTIQLHTYMVAYNLLYGVKPQGAIPWFAVRLKGLRPDCFNATLLEYPTPDREEILREWFQATEELYKQAPRAPTGLARSCYQWGRLCEFATSGQCKWGQI